MEIDDVNKISFELAKLRFNIADFKNLAQDLCADKQQASAEYYKSVATALCDKEKMIEYYNSFDDIGKDIIKKLVFGRGVSHTYLESTYHIVRSYFGSFGTSIDVRFPFSFMCKINYYTNFFALPQIVKRVLRSHFDGVIEIDKYIEESDFEKSASLFSEKMGEELFYNIANVINILSDSGFFSRPLGSPVLKGTVNKVYKLCDFSSFYRDSHLTLSEDISLKNLGCFYTEKEIDKFKNARINLALAFLSLAARKYEEEDSKKYLQDLSKNSGELYRALIHNFFMEDEFRVDEKYFYPYLSISTNSYYYELRKNIFQPILERIKENPPMKATDFSYYITIFDDEKISSFFTYDDYGNYLKTYSVKKSNYSAGYEVNSEKLYMSGDVYAQFVFESVYTNLFLMLASLGLFEIIWEESADFTKSELSDIEKNLNDKIFFPYGKIKAIKMTALGAYAFHITDNLFLSAAKTFSPPVFDERELLVHIEKGDKPSQIFFEKFCIPLSSTLFKVDMLKLSKCCFSQGDVKNLFETLENKAQKSLAENWKRLEKEMISSFVFLEIESDWIVISLENQSDSFIRCIEKVSRSLLCTKMEGMKIAVKKENLSDFCKAVQNNGFKIEMA